MSKVECVCLCIFCVYVYLCVHLSLPFHSPSHCPQNQACNGVTAKSVALGACGCLASESVSAWCTPQPAGARLGLDIPTRLNISCFSFSLSVFEVEMLLMKLLGGVIEAFFVFFLYIFTISLLFFLHFLLLDVGMLMMVMVIKEINKTSFILLFICYQYLFIHLYIYRFIISFSFSISYLSSVVSRVRKYCLQGKS